VQRKSFRVGQVYHFRAVAVSLITVPITALALLVLHCRDRGPRAILVENDRFNEILVPTKRIEDPLGEGMENHVVRSQRQAADRAGPSLIQRSHTLIHTDVRLEVENLNVMAVTADGGFLDGTVRHWAKRLQSAPEVACHSALVLLPSFSSGHLRQQTLHPGSPRAHSLLGPATYSGDDGGY